MNETLLLLNFLSRFFNLVAFICEFVEINSEQYFYVPVSAYLIYGDFTATAAVCLFSCFA